MPTCWTDLEPLFDVVKQYPLLDRDEERKLLVLKCTGDMGARDRLVLCNLRLVVSMSARVAKKVDVEVDDLISCGNIGLQHAVDKFDLSYNCKLSTYAVHWIRQHHSLHIKRRHLISIPNHLHSLLSSIADEWVEDHPHKRDVLTAAGADTYHRYVTTLDEPTAIVDMLPAPEENAAEVNDERENMVRRAADMLRRLPERERIAVRMRHEHGMTLDGVGGALGVTKERARQIIKNAMHKLRRESDDAEQVRYSTGD